MENATDFDSFGVPLILSCRFYFSRQPYIDFIFKLQTVPLCMSRNKKKRKKTLKNFLFFFERQNECTHFIKVSYTSITYMQYIYI